MRNAILGVPLLVLAMFAADTNAGQDKKKDFKALDADALKAFADGNYEEAHKIWYYIWHDYPRGTIGRLPASDPRFIAWQKAYHAAIIRDGLANKHALLGSDDATKKASADKAYTDAVEKARDEMATAEIPKAEQDKLIKAAAQPLLDILKKKDAPEKK